jgi:hypothetical protein
VVDPGGLTAVTVVAGTELVGTEEVGIVGIVEVVVEVVMSEPAV